MDDLSELPTQVHRILDTDVEALSTNRVVDVGGVTGEEDAPGPVGRGLSRHVGEPGDRGGTVDPVVGTPYGDKRLAEITQVGLADVSDLPFGHQDPRPTILQLAEGLAPEGVVVDTPLGLLGQLGLGDQEARRRLPPWELDAGRLADHTAPSIAPDEVVRA